MTAISYTPENTLETIDFMTDIEYQLDQEEHLKQESIIAMFDGVVRDLRTLIEDGDNYLKIPSSNGKDSSVCVLAAIEAYRQSIAAGKIDKMKPLIISTVHTLVESLPMIMYSQFSKKRIEAYAKQVGINLYYDFISPFLSEQFFVKYAGAQKYVNNASRTGDCAVIMKLDPARRYLKNIINRFTAQNGDRKSVV